MATVIARMRVGISPIDQAMPPVYWSSSGVGPHVRPIDPNQSATMSPDCIMMAMPKKACIAMMTMSSSSRPGWGSRQGTGSMPINVRANR
jgi:hypothetical protein